ncbi:MAG TPA: PQQ-binding-like beta-propeller repeat protein [Planctomycetota bacterium]|nr:PQQ-binding-like beta-propeller repeat protein [Planctomycetota bacterium]
MTRSARRRWSRDLEHEVDGLAIASAGPVLVHGYEPPAGGRWVDSAIPGRLTALERQSGDIQWSSPCEVGYGRGFGAGFGADGDVVLVGPSAGGHRIARMSVATGELLAVSDIPTFDEAVVEADLCLVASARAVTAVDSRTLAVRWRYARSGERYHRIARSGSHVFVSYTHDSNKKQGLLRLKASSGAFDCVLLEPLQPAIYDLAVDGECVALLAADLAGALPREQALELLLADEEASGEAQGVGLIAFDATRAPGSRARWFERLDDGDDEPDLAVIADSDKVYIARGTLLEVRDALTGRRLGEYVVPGLDDRVGWTVRQGAGLLAEERRVSVFELLA